VSEFNVLLMNDKVESMGKDRLRICSKACCGIPSKQLHLDILGRKQGNY
jgi:hypothetical protein